MKTLEEIHAEALEALMLKSSYWLSFKCGCILYLGEYSGMYSRGRADSPIQCLVPFHSSPLDRITRRDWFFKVMGTGEVAPPKTLEQHLYDLEGAKNLGERYIIKLKCGCVWMLNPSWSLGHRGTCTFGERCKKSCRLGRAKNRVMTHASIRKFFRDLKQEHLDDS